MAIRTTFELFDIMPVNADLHINATDLEGNTQTVITAAEARRYVIRKYATRRYTMLSGGTVTPADAGASLVEDFTLWVKNRQHNIDKQYQALFDYDYSPIENVDRYETESIEKDIATTYGKVDTESGTDTTQFGKVDTESGTDTTQFGKIDTLSGTDETEYGKVETLSGEDETTYGKVETLSGSDETEYGKVETLSGEDETTFGKVETNGGSDTVTDSGSDTTTRNGDHTTETTKAGFNAPNAYTPSEKVEESYTDLEDATDYGKVETTTHGHTVTNSGSDSVEYGKTTTDSGSDTIDYGKITTDSGSDSVEYGKTTTNSGSDSITYGKKNTESGSDSVTYGHKNTQSGSDSVTYGHKNTQSGSDSTDDDTERELHVHGNIGVTTNNQLIEAEIEMRNMSLAEMLLDNFINDYTFYS